ncbi:uncharacterized protein LOC120342569 [Styela clava]|uniref:uncharacterized protein LOC120342569 n=1 Tax=Styela clava TaxID=7725 RepID=UPI00193A684F|nr:uncharacterized protein LOC120342569 [Styela clava]
MSRTRSVMNVIRVLRLGILWMLVHILKNSVSAKSILYPESHFQIQNTQSTITMPEYTTRESLLRSRPDVKNHEGLLRQCEYFPTPRLRQLCERIAENPIIVSMKEKVRGHLKQLPWTTQITKSDIPLEGQQGLKCPDYSHQTPYVQPHDRSLSPWKMMPDFDVQRYPQWIPVARCMCKGCIDQRSGKENKAFVSKEIKVKVRFLRMNSTHSSFRQCTDSTCYASDEDIAVGCHCAIPVELSP